MAHCVGLLAHRRYLLLGGTDRPNVRDAARYQREDSRDDASLIAKKIIRTLNIQSLLAPISGPNGLVRQPVSREIVLLCTL